MKKVEGLDRFLEELIREVESDKNMKEEEKLEYLFFIKLATYIKQKTGGNDLEAVLGFWDKAHDFTSEEEFQKKLKAFLEAAIKEKDISDTEQPSDTGESRTAGGRE